MFENELKAKLTKIFKVKKVTFDEDSDQKEQECLFVDVDTAKFKVSKPTARAKVEGSVKMNANADKLGFGYFSKCIQEAKPADTKDFFFYDFEENVKTRNNLVQRSFKFVYFFSGQYDPKVGKITSLDLNITEE